MERIIVIGSSCAGKSTFAQKLAKKLNKKYIELDQLHWLPNWQERSDPEFRHLVDTATASRSWIVDGNYSVTRDITWPKATCIIWLNMPFHVVLYSAFKRSLMRAITQEKVCAGNTESFRHSFFSRESVILWVLKTYFPKRHSYRKLLALHQNISIVELNNRKAIQAYLSNINS